MQISDDDSAYLLHSIKNGSAMLVLGAGASVSSKNSRGEAIKSGYGLARTLSERAALPYGGEKLTEVLGAVRGRVLSDLIIREILVDEYKNCRPSKELCALFDYSWRRVYTWNIDDTLQNINQRTAQARYYYNGLSDKAQEFDGHNRVHVIHLHGEVNRLEHGFILTEQEYGIHVKSEKHYWYQRAAQDYLSTCPIFIGSQLDEPILIAELERAKRDAGAVNGKAFLIVPDEFSPIRKGHLDSRGITHVKATLEEFSTWLQRRVQGGWSVRDVVSLTSKIPEKSIDAVSVDEAAAAAFLKIIDPKEFRSSFELLRKTDRDLAARQFLQGFPPYWHLAASKVPVWLEHTNDLYTAFSKSIAAHNKLFVVSGQAGSGKTTAAMQVCLRYAEQHGLALWDLDPNIRSVANAFRLLKKVKKSKAILYVGDLFVYGDFFKDELEKLSGEDIIVVSTARSGEWNEHLKRYLGSIVKPFVFQRFMRNDYDPLISRLIEYVPSPGFRKLTNSAQHERLAGSNSQLLIALREATGSQNFNDIITNEFEGLPDQETKHLFLIVALSTLARVGISTATAKEAYEYSSPVRSFDAAVQAMDGIILEQLSGRMTARHELYVRHVLDNVVDFSDIADAIKAILRTFIKFNVPVIRSVNRHDSALFRYILNHRFIQAHARRHRKLHVGLGIYEDFEVDFQLDGHYWLQYGLYLVDMVKLDDAADKLEKSIEAYPENNFAVHALADIQLRIAAHRPTYNAATRALIDKATETLMIQDSRPGLEIDRYPIVTLVNGNLGALIRHGQSEEAKENARKYFDRVQQIEKVDDSSPIIKAKERLLRFITLGEWAERKTDLKPGDTKQATQTNPKKRRPRVRKPKG